MNNDRIDKSRLVKTTLVPGLVPDHAGQKNGYRRNGELEPGSISFSRHAQTLSLEDGVCLILFGLGKEKGYDPLEGDDKDHLFEGTTSWVKDLRTPRVDIGGLAYIPDFYKTITLNGKTVIRSNDHGLANPDELVCRLLYESDAHDMTDRQFLFIYSRASDLLLMRTCSALHRHRSEGAGWVKQYQAQDNRNLHVTVIPERRELVLSNFESVTCAQTLYIVRSLHSV